MYEHHYGLSTAPFRLTPDYQFVFRHKHYARARAYVDYALQQGEGFVVITGQPGMGKTTLVRDIEHAVAGTGITVATVVSTQMGADDLLLMTAYGFGVDAKVTTKATILHKLIRHLADQRQAGRRALLVVDEAQDLSTAALEELRLMTNFQRSSEPLLQIVLVGQESFRALLGREEMEQVRQRIVAAWHLEPLELGETVEYVRHRLRIAGWRGDPAFQPGVMRAVHAYSGGVPRRINLVCSRLLLYGFSEDLHSLSASDAERVVAELSDEEFGARESPSLAQSVEVDGKTPDAPDRDSDSQTGSAESWSVDQGLFGDTESDLLGGLEVGGGVAEATESNVCRSPKDQPGELTKPAQIVFASGAGDELTRSGLEESVKPAATEVELTFAGSEGRDQQWHEVGVETIDAGAATEKDETGSRDRSSAGWRWFIGGVMCLAAGTVALYYTGLPAWEPIVARLEQLAGVSQGVPVGSLKAPVERGEETPGYLDKSTSGSFAAGPSLRLPQRDGRMTIEANSTVTPVTQDSIRGPAAAAEQSGTAAAKGREGGGSSQDAGGNVSRELPEPGVTHGSGVAGPVETPKTSLTQGKERRAFLGESATVEPRDKERRASSPEHAPDEPEILRAVGDGKKAEASSLRQAGRTGLESVLAPSVSQAPAPAPRSRNLADVGGAASVGAEPSAREREQQSNGESQRARPMLSGSVRSSNDGRASASTPDVQTESDASSPLTRLQIQFGWDSAEVDERFTPILARAVDELNRHPNSVAEIVGYTDGYGNPDYNMALSQRRAEAVARHLAQRGVSRSRLRVSGEGVRAEANAGDQEGLGLRSAEDRRVEVSVLRGSGES